MICSIVYLSAMKDGCVNANVNFPEYEDELQKFKLWKNLNILVPKSF